MHNEDALTGSLSRLAELHRQGQLSDDEFTAAKAHAIAARGTAPDVPTRSSVNRRWNRGRVLIGVLAVVAATVGGTSAVLLAGDEGALSDAECTQALEEQYEMGKVNADAYPIVRDMGCGSWLDRLASGDISEEEYDGTAAPSAEAGAEPAVVGAHGAYSAEVSAAGEAVLFATQEAFDTQVGLICGLPLDEMTAWMRLQVESGSWPQDQIKTQLLNSGSLVRHACPAKLPAFTEASRQTVFAGPGSGTTTDNMPNSLKKAMFDECMKRADEAQDLAMLEACRAYI